MSETVLMQTALDFQHAGQDAAERASGVWFGEALAFIEAMPRGVEFTADDLVRRFGEPPSQGVSGAVTTRAQSKGWIRGDGYLKSSRITNRGRVIAKWVRR